MEGFNQAAEAAGQMRTPRALQGPPRLRAHGSGGRDRGAEAGGAPFRRPEARGRRKDSFGPEAPGRPHVENGLEPPARPLGLPSPTYVLYSSSFIFRQKVSSTLRSPCGWTLPVLLTSMSLRALMTVLMFFKICV